MEKCRDGKSKETRLHTIKAKQRKKFIGMGMIFPILHACVHAH